MNIERRVRDSIEASIAAKQALLNDAAAISAVTLVSEVLIDVYRRGNKLLVFGNGGSAADAQHIVAELVGRFAFDRPALPALALTVNSSCVTAIGNDYGYDLVFARQIEGLGAAGDAAIGISTSGNSSNVLKGIAAAKRKGLHTIGLTGAAGGALKDAADYCIQVPSKDTPRIQEGHILIGHILSELVEEAIFRD